MYDRRGDWKDMLLENGNEQFDKRVMAMFDELVEVGEFL